MLSLSLGLFSAHLAPQQLLDHLQAMELQASLGLVMGSVGLPGTAQSLVSKCQH